MAIGLTQLPVTISNGTALSPAVALGEFTLCGIAMPAGWVGTAGLSFQVSADGGTTWGEMQSAAAAIFFAAAASQYIAIDPTLWRGINMIKIRSGTLASPANQTGDQILTLVARRLI
jgi:hypothetical protein